MPANEFYDSSGAPATSSFGSSSTIRAEFDLVEDGFNKLPALTANADKAVFINASGTAMTSYDAATARSKLNAASLGANSFTATQTIDGGLTFTGAARRILGDFSNATDSSRASFQSSTANGITIIQAFPNGSGVRGAFRAFAGSDLDNAHYATLEANSSSNLVILNSSKNGTGTTRPISLQFDGVEKVSISTAGALNTASTLSQNGDPVVTLGGNNTLIGLNTFATPTLAGEPLTVTGTNAGAQGPNVIIQHDSVSPLATDQSYLTFRARNSAAGLKNYTQLRGTIVTVTNGAEDGKLELWTIGGGTEASRVVVQAGVQIMGAGGAAPTGNDAGVGIVNAAVGFKVNNVAVPTLTSADNLQNKTVTAPVLSGTVTGTYTLGGTPTISSPTLSGTMSGGTVAPTTLTVPSGTTLTSPVINSATGIGQSITVRKTADESVTSSTALQDDDHLSFAIGANEEWVVRFTIFVSNNLGTTGIRVAINAPGGATIRHYDALHADGNSIGGMNTGIGSSAFTAASMSSSNAALLMITLWVLNGATPGTVQLRWCQDTSSATALTFNRGSHLVAIRTT